jgi:hypothetical protein
MHRRPFIINGLFALLLVTGVHTAEAQEIENLLAMNTPVASTKDQAPERKSNHPAVNEVTSKDEFLVSSYFTLAGKRIVPYMMVDNSSFSFEPSLLESGEMVSIQFNNDHVEYIIGNKTHRLEIEHIDQLSNKSGNCLVTGKIEIHCTPSKISDEKIEEIGVFLDHDNHITFIQIGDAEYYLRP